MMKKLASLSLLISIISMLIFPSMEPVWAEEGKVSLTKVAAIFGEYYVDDTIVISITVSDPDQVDWDESCVWLHRVRQEGEIDTGSSASIYHRGSGNYEAHFFVSEDDRAGDYYIDLIWLYDLNGNLIEYAIDESNTEDIIPHGYFTVVTDNTDVASPVLTKVVLPSKTVKTGETFSITVYAEDQSGVDASESSVIIKAEEYHKYQSRKSTPLKDNGDGTYTAEFKVTDKWLSGEYVIEQITLTDTNGYYDMYYNDNYSDKDDIIPENAITVISNNTDTVGPTVSLVEAKPQTVRPGDQIRQYVMTSNL